MRRVPQVMLASTELLNNSCLLAQCHAERKVNLWEYIGITARKKVKDKGYLLYY